MANRTASQIQRLASIIWPARFSMIGMTGLAMLLLAALVPVFGSPFYVRLAIEALLFGAIALSVDILLGFAGLLSLGQTAYFGMAAYISALLFLHVTHSFWLVLLIAVAAVSVFAAIIGSIAIRSRGVYFALITFAVSEVLRKISFNTHLLGGSDGLLGIPIPTVHVIGLVQIPLANDIAFFYFVLTLIAVLYLAINRIIATPFGTVLTAIRDNEKRVPYLGYNPFWFKLIAFVAAAQVAAVAGVIHPLLRGFVSPELFGFESATRAVVMALVGGVGTLLGPLIGGSVITLLESVVSSFTERHLTVLGAIFVIFVLFRPDGLMGLIRSGLQRFGGRTTIGVAHAEDQRSE